ncbi:hypothetical protein [Streptomyces sp. N35]|uniref:hypothetical protein n=1 Tax=Streptomyces sp. N35 TaxID=2795730 RepID=UPI0018F67A45|nr:hypothetical protein [Streptomyces sp. N35]
MSASVRRKTRHRVLLLAAAGLAAVSATGCGGSADAVEGLPVKVVNKSAWDAQVFDCPPCGEHGIKVERDPDRSAGGGLIAGWDEEREWPVTYRVVVRGVESTCPFIDPAPAKSAGEGAVGTRDVIYVVDEAGKCVEGPTSIDDI